MKKYFTDKFEEFLKSNDSRMLLETKAYKTDNNPFIEKRKINENCSIIYYSEGFDDELTFSLEPTLLVNNEGELLFIIDSYNSRKYLEEIFNDDNVKDKIEENFRTKDRTFVETVKTRVETALNAQYSSYIDNSEEKKRDYAEKGLSYFTSNTKPTFSVEYSKTDNFEYVNNLLFNYDDFLESEIEKCIEKNKEKFTNYVNVKEAYDKIIENINKNDNGKFKTRVLEIFNTRKYKNLKIGFIYPNGEKQVKSYGKEMDRYGWEQVKRDIISKEKVSNIPIFAIKFIKWSRSTLLDANEYNIEYEKDKMQEDFIKLDNIEKFPEEFYDNEDFCRKIIKVNFCNFGLISDRLKNNKEFILSVADDVNRINTLKDISEDLKLDINFMNDFLPKEIGRYNYDKIVNEIPESGFEDINMINLLLSRGIGIDYFAHRIKESLIFSKEFIKILNGEKITRTPEDENIFRKHELSELEKVFDANVIRNKFHIVKYELLPQEKIIDYIVNEDFRDAILFIDNGDHSMIEYFANDEYMLYQISRGIRSANTAKCFLEEIGIDIKYNNNDIIPFCSYNAYFFHFLDENNKRTFLESEIANIESYTVESECETVFHTDYSDLRYRERYYYYGSGLKITTKGSNCYQEDISEYLNYVSDSLKDFVENETGNRPTNTEEIAKFLYNYEQEKKEKDKPVIVEEER